MHCRPNGRRMLTINLKPFAEVLTFDETVGSYVEDTLGIDINKDGSPGQAVDIDLEDGEQPSELLLGLLGLECLPGAAQASESLRNVLGLLRHLQLPLDGIAFAPGGGIFEYLERQNLDPADAPTAVALLAFLAAKDRQLATRVARALQPYLVAKS